ncbi:MAG: 1-acyl-sn-glycerol-3-phosphate acyltransferase, partial [Chthoniobacteraceae bacterium]
MENPPSRPSFLDRVIRAAGHFLCRIVYRVRAQHTERLPEGGFLLLPNHLTWVDAIVLQQACPRPIRFIVDDEIHKLRLLNPIFRAVGVIPISAKRAKDGVRTAVERIQAGEIVCIFPEGELSRTGTLLRLKRGYELIARQANAPVVPVWLDQLWGSIFSFEGGSYFFKWPKKLPYPVTVNFGDPIPAAEADVSTVRERLLELGERCYQERPMLQEHLGEVC